MAKDLTGLTELPPLAPEAEPEAQVEAEAEAQPEAAAHPAAHPMDMLKDFADNVPMGNPQVQAAFPFSLSITGQLQPEEKERLLDLLAREKMGIREVDLEPQLAAGRILIPRISEYAGILLVQALRSAQVEIHLGPSDQIFATDATRSPEAFQAPAPESRHTVYSNEPRHPADRIPVTSLPALPELPQFEVIEVLTASAGLDSRAVEAQKSQEYQELLESLQREIRHRAHLKGAAAVVNYQVQLTALGLPTRYRVTATGSAIRASRPQNQ